VAATATRTSKLPADNGNYSSLNHPISGVDIGDRAALNVAFGAYLKNRVVGFESNKWKITLRKTRKTCCNTQIAFYLETYGGQNFNVYIFKCCSFFQHQS
jgi:hypothetical protein